MSGHVHLPEDTAVETMFKIGDTVKIVSAYFGYGSMAKYGDMCHIRDSKVDGGKTVYTLTEIDGLYSTWYCLKGDMELVDVHSPQYVKDRGYINFGRFCAVVQDLCREEIKIIDNKLNELEVAVSKQALYKRSLATYMTESANQVRDLSKNVDTRKKFDLLLDTMYEGIIREGKMLFAVTKPINITISPSGMPISLGRYRVHVHFRDGLTTIDRLDEDAHFDRKGGTVQHPHILDRHPCLGDYQLHIVKAMERVDYLSVLEIVYDYLSHVFLGSTYAKPILWAVDRTKRCRQCWQKLSACTCGVKIAFNPLEHGDELRDAEVSVHPEQRCANCEELIADCTCGTDREGGR